MAIIEIKGIVDENTDLRKLFSTDDKIFDIYCKEIVRITSAGLKEWLSLLKNIRLSGRVIRFFDLSPVIVRQVANVSNVVLAKEVFSICAEYVCSHCHHKELKSFTPKQLENLGYQLESFACSKCKNLMEFDDLPDEYFSFLKKG